MKWQISHEVTNNTSSEMLISSRGLQNEYCTYCRDSYYAGLDNTADKVPKVNFAFFSRWRCGASLSIGIHWHQHPKHSYCTRNINRG